MKVNPLQTRFLILATAFVSCYAIALTISPAVRARSWDVDLRWGHWLGWSAWLLVFGVIHFESRRLKAQDPFLIPILAVISGWGLLTIWRLTPAFGLRQTVWLMIAGLVFTVGLRLSPRLAFLYRYKYVWLSAGLVLTALTLILGSNPIGYGPRLWLGCCDIYFQPSELLKLLLIVYLSAYLADFADSSASQGSERSFSLMLAPTLVMTGLALLVMLVQRDLGTTAIFLFLYSVVVYVATGRKRFLFYSLLTILLSAGLAYALFDVVRLRVDAWLNPWLDPSGGSYQIVQSLLAVANGGLLGRGPGMGSPGFVPVAHSDFIFAALAEENGLVGIVLLLSLLAVLTARGLRAALQVEDRFRRLLAAGLTAYLVAQSILIVGGNLRLLPLTGVTLPFMSYGGSSLLVSFVSLLLILKVGEGSFVVGDDVDEKQPAPRSVLVGVTAGPYRHLILFLFAGLLALGLTAGWWAYVRGPDLLTRTDNPRRALADRSVPRGAILDRNNKVLVDNIGTPGELSRSYNYPPLSPLLGYVHPVYGQAGLEASLDAYLGGRKGVSGLSTWWQHLLYGQSPPGLDVRLSLDLDLQQAADDLLGEQSGAAVLLNADTGEILAMASHPTYDANQLDQEGENLQSDPAAPLFNRATLGLYPINSFLEKFFTSTKVEISPAELDFAASSTEIPSPSAGYDAAGLFVATPLQLARFGAAVSAQGLSPVIRILNAVNTPQAGWVPIPANGEPHRMFSSQEVDQLVEAHTAEPYWQVAQRSAGGTWFLGGTLPDWQGTPLAMVVYLEDRDPEVATTIGRGVLDAATSP